jgi:pyochelin biosynthesis protein PchC
MTSDETIRWIRRLKPVDDPAARLICFPHAGGSASSFAPFARTLDNSIEVLAIQSPGRQDRRNEPCLHSVSELATAAFPAVLAQTDRPIALFGHSLGAIVAFEVARTLEATRVAPRIVFVSGRRAPSTRRTESVHRLSDAGILAELRMLGGPGIQFLDDEDVAREFLPSIRSDYTAIETYRCEPEARLNCPVTALVGDHDPCVTLDEAVRWSGHTTADFALHVFAGGHFYLYDQREGVAEIVERRLLSGL